MPSAFLTAVSEQQSLNELRLIIADQLERINRYKTVIRVMSAALNECEAYLDRYSDVVDGVDGIPSPNVAMSLLIEVREALRVGGM